MTDRKTMEALIEQAYAARKEGDIDKLMSAFHPDAEFELAGSKALLSVAGAMQGHQNIRAIMTGFVTAFDFLDRKIVSTVIEDERATVHSRVEIKFVPTGKTFTTDILDSFCFKDGKVFKLVEFADTALIKDMMPGDK